MATTRLVGSDGDITMPSGHNAVISSWSGNISQVVTETTGFGDSFRQYRGGIMGMRWSANGTPKSDASTHIPLPGAGTLAMSITGATLTLKVASAVSTECSYAGSAIVESFDVSSEKTGAATLAYAGVITGTITQTWDET